MPLPKLFNSIANNFIYSSKLINPNVRNVIRYHSRQSSQYVTVERRDDITLIGINRPEKKNCVNFETGQQLLQAFEQFDHDDQSKIAVLYGHGGCFCAGFDLEQISQMKQLGKEFDVPRGPMGISQMLTSKPVVGAINGYAVAGGFELALWCDLRVIEETAVMGVFCRRFGVPLIDGGTVRLTKLIGLARAMELILTGRPIQGKEALTWGLATRCVAVGTALGQAIDLASSLTKFPQECLKADRRSAYYSTFDAQSIEDALKFEYENGKGIIEKEAIHGATRFVKEKVGKHGKFVLDKWDHNPKVTV